jgi:hypothetical protein
MDMQSFMINDWKLSRSVRGVYCNNQSHQLDVCVHLGAWKAFVTFVQMKIFINMMCLCCNLAALVNMII